MRQDHPCKGCVYFFGRAEGNECCNYIFIVGHRRPCPPGKDCTEKRTYPEEEKNTDEKGRP